LLAHAFPDEATSHFLAYFWQKEVAAPPRLLWRAVPEAGIYSCAEHRVPTVQNLEIVFHKFLPAPRFIGSGAK